MRNYSEEVEVRVSAPEESAARGPEPSQFLWRGRLWKVRVVLARWVETPPWWPSVASSATGRGRGAAPSTRDVSEGAVEIGELVRDRECWRVEAGDRTGSGVFDLALTEDGRWELVGCAD